jgi:hypothetical protein
LIPFSKTVQAMDGLLAVNFAGAVASAQEQLPATLGAPYIPLLQFKADKRPRFGDHGRSRHLSGDA